MDDQDQLAAQFEGNRSHLRAVAYRMLGSLGEADDVVQEAWLRLSRSDMREIENLGGWLTTVVARVSLDVLRSRRVRHEEPLHEHVPAIDAIPAAARDTEHDVLLADSVGPALLRILDTLAPAERVAFVLHDMFGMSFDEIGPIVGRSETAARQLASRARRRVQRAPVAVTPDLVRKRRVVEAFLAASRGGDLGALLAVLDPDVVLRADAAAVAAARQAAGGPTLAPEVRGAAAVAETFSGRARAAQSALVYGELGAVWAPGGTPRVAFAFTITGDTIAAIEIIADPVRVGAAEITVLDARPAP